MSTHSPRENHDSAGRHSVWGRVVDRDSGPVPTAEIFWVDAAHAGAETVSLFDVHKVATADMDGRFWAPDLPPGPALLLADFSRLRITGDQVRMAHALPITLPWVAGAGSAAGGDITLDFPHSRTEFGSIHAVITDAIDRRPASRQPVALFRIDDLARPLRQVETTTSGVVKFEWLREGKYRFCIYGTTRHMEGEQTIDLRRNGRIDAKVGLVRRPTGPRSTTRVHVTDRLGIPLAGALVQVLIPSIHIAARPTDAAGFAIFSDLPARPNAVTASAPGHFPGGTVLPEFDTPDSADAEIALEPTVRLRVIVLHAATDRPVRNANLRVRHTGGDYSDWGGVLPPPDAPPRNFRDIDVRTGPVEIHASSPGLPAADVTLAVFPDDPDPVVVTLRLG